MENEYTQEIKTQSEKYPFLKDPDAKKLFGRIDFELKSGRHIQYMHPTQGDLFSFIKYYSESLNDYYVDFFHINLESGGIDSDTYFYLDFEGNKRGEIPVDRRYFLSEEHLLIGVFMCKVYNIDFNSEESSLSILQKLVKEEYEEYKDDFYRLLAQTQKKVYTGDDDIDIDKSIKSALKEFEALGWIYFKNDEQFVIMPSLERLRKLYADEINNIQKLVASNSKA